MKKLTREEIEKILKDNDLYLESFKPDKIRLYAVLWKFDIKKKFHDGYFTFNQLCLFLIGFNAGYNQRRYENMMEKLDLDN